MHQVTATTPVDPSGGPPARRRRSLLGLGGMGLAVLLVLSACDEEGQDAPVTAGVPDVAYAHGDVGDMVLDVVFIESGGTVEAGMSAPIRGNFTNDAETPDQLVSVSTPAGPVDLLDADGLPSAQSIDIPADGEVDAVNGVVRIQLTDAYYPLPATQIVPVTFEFSGAGQVTLNVPVAAPTAPAP